MAVVALAARFHDPRGLNEEVYAGLQRILTNTDSRRSSCGDTGLEMVVVEGFDYLSGQVYPLVMELAGSGNAEWKLVYSDSKSVIFMRNPPAGVAARNSLEALLESLEKQCGQHIQHEPARPYCAAAWCGVRVYRQC